MFERYPNSFKQRKLSKNVIEKSVRNTHARKLPLHLFLQNFTLRCTLNAYGKCMLIKFVTNKFINQPTNGCAFVTCELTNRRQYL